jgi:phosphoglycerate-specific signal transduction histidine kinase
MKIEYLNQRVDKRVVKRLRKFERSKKLEPSISKTIDFLLDQASALEILSIDSLDEAAQKAYKTNQAFRY